MKSSSSDRHDDTQRYLTICVNRASGSSGSCGPSAAGTVCGKTTKFKYHQNKSSQFHYDSEDWSVIHYLYLPNFFRSWKNLSFGNFLDCFNEK
jgi:hypothetical protein